MATETTAAAGDGLATSPETAPGMPQLDFSTFGNQIFWLIVTLVVIYFVLSRVALPRIAAVLAERQGTITNDIAKAEDLKKQAAEAEQAYEKALADARVAAQKIAEQTREEIKGQVADAQAKADAEISAKTAESEKEIDAIRASAMENVEAVAKDTAAAVVAALGSSADQAEIDKAVDARMKG
ncbi:F-type H+-transporting ATPase subunit b [Roseivivax lentus]|uniref:ATP synthase subunit b n=1 Tax=Roseivivax lentus TaxID=633194 RepID=A0A1N7MDT0_9RHOB|nr:F0F1 ATP synthase subunit B' [Roseivivax lentus]SIS84188.1 F-type H+-transporting ATPase subunit b [Roseivivax lentus]